MPGTMDEKEENRASGRGTEAEKGRNEQFSSDQAREEAADKGELGRPVIESDLDKQQR